MSKKQLLEEATIRKFMRLANLEPLSDRFIKEEMGFEEEDEDMAGNEDPAAAAAGGPMDMGGADDASADVGGEMPMDDVAGSDEEEIDVQLGDEEGGEVSPEVAKKVIQAVLDALGVQGTVEDDEDMGDDGEVGDMDSDMGGEEDAGDESESDDEGEAEEEAPEDDSEESEESDEEELEEQALSEDELIENVLRRVTARLVSEAKKAKSVKEKMKQKKKKKEELDEEKHVVTHKKQNPLLTKGANKHNVYKGTPDMEMKPLKGKGEKTGKGGHEMKPLKKSKNHIVTNGKDHNKLPSKGPNKG